MDKIRLGLPKGSLNTRGRGNTCQLFLDAGYDIIGYEPGNESENIRIDNDPEIEIFLSRPQSAPIELHREMLDIAIIGEDWVREEGSKCTLIGDLQYGKTKLVAALPRESPYDNLSEFFFAQRDAKSPILCFTEYVNITREHFMKNEGYQEVYGHVSPLVQVRGLVNGKNELVQILNSDGVTEGYVRKGAPIIVDNTQTGSALRKHGLKILETIMKSSAGLYAGPSCMEWKMEKAEEIKDMLQGAVEGRRHFDVKFNVPNNTLEGAVSYLTTAKLCAHHPTVMHGESFSSVHTIMPRAKFPSTVRTLRRQYQATDIVRNEVKQYIG